MTKLILVRHGESEANELGLFAGHLDVDLTERGLKQAELTAEYIVSHYVVDKVYASDLKRAYNTGKAVAEKAGVPIIPRQDLREIGAGDWDGKRFDDLDKLYPKDFEVWYQDLPHARCTNGEAVAEVANRVYRAMVEIAQENDGKTVVLASHATPIRTALAMIQPQKLDAMDALGWVPNASVTVLSYEDGRWTTELVGMADHLAELKTVLPANV